jgi:hypothetical protein
VAGAKRRRLSESERAKLVADIRRFREQGATVHAIAEKTGWSYSFVRRVLRNADVTRRTRVAAVPDVPSPREDAHRLLDLVPPDEIPAVIEHLRHVTAAGGHPAPGRRTFRTIAIFDGDADLGARSKDILRQELGSRDDRSA